MRLAKSFPKDGSSSKSKSILVKKKQFNSLRKEVYLVKQQLHTLGDSLKRQGQRVDKYFKQKDKV